MLWIKLRSILSSLIFLSATSQAAAFTDIVNGAINDIIDNVELDSFLELKCSDFNLNPSDLKFSIAGCEIDLSSKECYSQTVDSFKDILDLQSNHFDKNKICKSYLRKEKKITEGINPFDEKNYITVKKLPLTMQDSEKVASEESRAIVASTYLAPKNSIGTKKRITKQVEKDCALSSNRESCVLSKSLSYAKNEREDYSEKSEDSFRALMKNKYIALSRRDGLYEGTNRILKKLPIEKRTDYLHSSITRASVNTASSILLNSSFDAEEMIFEKYAEVVARAVSLDYRDAAKKIADKSGQGWKLP